VKYHAYTSRTLRTIPQLAALPAERIEEMRVVASVLPFKVNSYVTGELIDWDRWQTDRMFELTFPRRGMLSPEHYDRVLGSGLDPQVIRRVRLELNPQSSDQLANAPDGLSGIQHKYAHTLLFFPAQGQTCHAYCSYCFRWPQFVGMDEMKFASKQADELVGYLRAHPYVTDVLFTGGDPMIMRASVLERYVRPILDAPDLGHVTIRIGSKALSYWPYRFLTDPDAGELLGLFREIAASRLLAFQAHLTLPVELRPPVVAEAIAAVRATGAVIRTQAPIIGHINDDVDIWVRMLQKEVRLGLVPYYMFVERDTGARHHFEIPLERALEVYHGVVSSLSGLAHTLRGPVMSASAGKVMLEDIVTIGRERFFVLRNLQMRDASRNGAVRFARYDPAARWYDDLEFVDPARPEMQPIMLER